MQNYSLTEIFLTIFMNELENFLNNDAIKKEIKTIAFHSDEANTDRPIKEFMQQLVMNKFNKIPSDLYNKNLILSVNNRIEKYEYKSFKDYSINEVYLPDQISEEIKQSLKVKGRVYTNPDLLFKIETDSGIHYEPIELKSTKKDGIPGSSVQQITGNEWVIFIKHSSSKVEISTGKYLCAINKKVQFPDRSPRPSVAFNELSIWNTTNRFNNTQSLEVNLSADDLKPRQDIINDWQDVLVSRWISVIKSSTRKKRETWFNNTIRKFTNELLSEYDSLSDKEKENFQTRIQSLIDKND